MSDTTNVVMFGLGVILIVAVVIGPLVVNWILRQEFIHKDK